MTDIEQLEQAIAALEAQRSLLGDAVVETMLAPAREKMATLKAHSAPIEQQRKHITILFADVWCYHCWRGIIRGHPAVGNGRSIG